MKKFLTLCALAAIAMPALTSQAETKYRLMDMQDDVNGESFDFIYDEATGNLKEYTVLSDIRARFEYEYDAQNRCIKETIFQDQELNHQYKATSYVAYTYDEQGRIETRANYGAGWLVGGDDEWVRMTIAFYSYDDQGRLICQDYYRDDEKNLHSMVVNFTYNDKGQLAQRDEAMYSLNGSTVSGKGRVVFTYDDNGRLIEKCTLTNKDDAIDDMRVQGYTVYVYGEDDIITEVYTTGSANNPDNKMTSVLYTVDETIPALQVIYPSAQIPEPYFESDVYSMQPYRIIGAKEDIRGNDELMVTDHNWTYNYEEIDDPAQIVNMGMAGRSLAAAAVNGDVLRLIGVNNASDVTITDLNGRIVKTVSHCNGSINVADLQKGVYVVSCREGAVKFVR